MSVWDEQAGTDEEVIRDTLNGKPDAFGILVRRYQDVTFNMILRQLGDRSTTEELTQETFVKAFQNLKSFRFESKFSSWLIRIALNHTNSFFVSRRYKKMVRTKTLEQENTGVDHGTPERQASNKQQLVLFQKLIADLKPGLREVLVLCGLEGKSYDEVAEILKIPTGTVRSRLNNARNLIKEGFLAQEAENES